MKRQIQDSKISRQKLDLCLFRESDSDTHAIDLLGLSSSIAAYACAIGRDASRRVRSRRAPGRP
ncbi:hypothetical protein [Brevundimonas sp.]|uniref:hypothetical protein n=1 Tax=Brevundimonas sp. TaxID=1871086 RepID=UPI002FC59E7F